MQARAILSRMLDGVCTVETGPEDMTGAMTSIIVPEPHTAMTDRASLYDDALQDALYERHRIVAPVWRFNPGNAPVHAAKNKRIVRLSAQVYNTLEQYEYFGNALLEELGRERG